MVILLFWLLLFGSGVGGFVLGVCVMFDLVKFVCVVSIWIVLCLDIGVYVGECFVI